MILKRIKLYGELVMFSHSIFSLPFALISMLWAAKGLPSVDTLFWVLLALVGARNGANALNRLIDQKIDAKNPRTAHRHLPQNLVEKYEVILLIIFCFALLFLSSYMLNPLCVKLLPVAIFLFIIYSYTKRFTWACHIILGIICGGAPVGAWIAVTGSIGWPAIVLGASATLWVAGFDIIYGTQDQEFDRKEGLFSIPARFGIKNALRIAAALHSGLVILLLYLYFLMKMGWLYLLGLVVITLLLYLEHYMVAPNKLQGVEIASYNINQVISIVLLVFTITDIFI